MADKTEDATARSLLENYSSVLGYLPQDAQQVVWDYLPRLEMWIDAETTKFGRQLSEFLKKQLSKELERGRLNIQKLLKKADSEVSKLKKSIKTGNDALEGLKRPLKDLHEAVEDLTRTKNTKGKLNAHLKTLKDQIGKLRESVGDNESPAFPDSFFVFYSNWRDGFRDICRHISGSDDSPLPKLDSAIEDARRSSSLAHEPEAGEQSEEQTDASDSPAHPRVDGQREKPSGPHGDSEQSAAAPDDPEDGHSEDERKKVDLLFDDISTLIDDLCTWAYQKSDERIDSLADRISESDAKVFKSYSELNVLREEAGTIEHKIMEAKKEAKNLEANVLAALRHGLAAAKLDLFAPAKAEAETTSGKGDSDGPPGEGRSGFRRST